MLTHSEDKIAIIFDINNLALRCFHTTDDWKVMTFQSCYEFILDSCDFWDVDMADVFLAVDGSGTYWRRDVYAHYKVDRADKRAKETHIDYEQLYKDLDHLMGAIKAHLPWSVIRVPKCEADDVIAVFCQSQNENYKRVIIHSTDSDYTQLVKDNVSLFSPMKGYISFPAMCKVGSGAHTCSSAEEFLILSCMTGQGGKDNVYNIATPTNWIPAKLGDRKPPFGVVAATKMWSRAKKDEERLRKILDKQKMLENYERNKQLIDFSCIPHDHANEISKEIIEARMQHKKINPTAFSAELAFYPYQEQWEILSAVAEAEMILPEL